MWIVFLIVIRNNLFNSKFIPMNNVKFTIAIDGPAASGKSSAAEIVAKKLNFERLDSGLLYRSITFLIYQKWVGMNESNLEDEEVRKFVDSLNIKQHKGRILWMDDTNQEIDITDHLRTPYIDSKVGKVSTLLYIRNKTRQIQGQVIEANKDGIVVDGRDIGTVVIPDAFLKVFITADDSVRAMRRSKQTGQNYDDVLKDLKERDRIDQTRKHGPLRKAEDAIEIKNDEISLEDTARIVVEEFETRRSQYK